MDRPAARQQRDRPAGVVGEMRVQGDAQVAVQGRLEVVGRQRPVARLLAAAVGRAHHLAHAQAAAREEYRHRPRPVLAAGLAVEVAQLRRVRHLAHYHQQHVVPQSALAQILDQGRYDLIPQCDGDLGHRLHHFFANARRHGYSRIIAVGADSPTLPIDYVEHAFTALEAHDVVIGPAQDGGYYLIGGSLQELAIFDDIPWSSTRVLEVTIECVQKASARLALLPPWYDVDTAADWAMLCDDVRARRLAGLDPGVPRAEQLMQGDV